MTLEIKSFFWKRPLVWLAVFFAAVAVTAWPSSAAANNLCINVDGTEATDQHGHVRGDWIPDWDLLYPGYHINPGEYEFSGTFSYYQQCSNDHIGNNPNNLTDCEWVQLTNSGSSYFPYPTDVNASTCWAASHTPDPGFRLSGAIYKIDGAGNPLYWLDQLHARNISLVDPSICGIPSNDFTRDCYQITTHNYRGLYYTGDCEKDLDCGVDSPDFCGTNPGGKPAIAYTHNACVADETGTNRCVQVEQYRKNCAAAAGNAACFTDVLSGSVVSGNICINGDTRGFNTSKGVCYLKSGKPSCGPTLDQANVPFQKCIETPGTYSYDYGAITCILSVYYNPDITTPCYQQGQCAITGCRGVLTNQYCYVRHGDGSNEDCADGTSDPFSVCVNNSCQYVYGSCGVSDCEDCQCPEGQTNPHSRCIDNKCTSIASCGVTDCSQCNECPEGQSNPHNACVNNSCVQVNSCGSSDCASCTECPEGQENPHFACVNGSCAQVNSCGVSDCSSCQQGGCPPGQTNPHSICTPETPHYYPLAYWKFNEGSGTSAADSSGYGSSGTLMGGVSYTSSSPSLQSPNPYAINFPGTSGSYVQTQDIDYGGYGVTVTAWVKANAGTYGYVASKNYNGVNVPFSLNVGGNNSPSNLDGMAIFYGGSWKNSGLGGVNIRGDGQFHFVAGVYNPTVSNKLRYYVDGVLRSSSTEVPVYTAVSNDNPVDIGAYRNDNQYFSGIIDEVTIYNWALSDGDIAALATGTSPTGGGGTCDTVNSCGTTDCAGCTECPAGQTYPYATCAYGACVQVNACGVPDCSACEIQCPAGQSNPHIACVNDTCTAVGGCGTNDCEDCSVCPAGQTLPHLECVNGTCATVDSCGVSDCSSCNACPAGQTLPHSLCVYGNCQAIHSCGAPNCLLCNPCPAGQTLPHTACVNGTCASVGTCGANDCSACQANGEPEVIGMTRSESGCTGVVGEAMVSLGWDYDNGGLSGTYLVVEVDNNSNFNNPEYRKTIANPHASDSQQIFIRQANDVTGCNADTTSCYLKYGTTYYMRVVAKASDDSVLGTWYYNVSGGTTTAPGTSYVRSGGPHPFPYFTYLPAQPGVGQTVGFTDGSICFDGNQQVFCQDKLSGGYSWYFGNESQSAAVGNTTYAFNGGGSKTVTLMVCDGGQCCQYNTPVQVRANKGNLPSFKEISPF